MEWSVTGLEVLATTVGIVDRSGGLIPNKNRFSFIATVVPIGKVYRFILIIGDEFPPICIGSKFTFTNHEPTNHFKT
jgi:hypothetical protein